jgi:hypothetical protein
MEDGLVVDEPPVYEHVIALATSQSRIQRGTIKVSSGYHVSRNRKQCTQHHRKSFCEVFLRCCADQKEDSAHLL